MKGGKERPFFLAFNAFFACLSFRPAGHINPITFHAKRPTRRRRRRKRVLSLLVQKKSLSALDQKEREKKKKILLKNLNIAIRNKSTLKERKYMAWTNGRNLLAIFSTRPPAKKPQWCRAGPKVLAPCHHMREVQIFPPRFVHMNVCRKTNWNEMHFFSYRAQRAAAAAVTFDPLR